MKINVAICTLLTLSLSAAENEEGFQRYQIIIDKRPFGEEPPEASAQDTPKQIPLNQSFAKDLRLTMLFEGPGGDIRAGVVNKARKKNYILNLGQAQDGILLEEADIEKSEALLKKGNEVALFKLEESTATPLNRKQQTNRKKTYAERRKALLNRVNAQKKSEQPQRPQLTGEALREHLKEVQMDAIRTGKPPLPMPLTPEMDAQLVEEGVLAPQ